MRNFKLQLHKPLCPRTQYLTDAKVRKIASANGVDFVAADGDACWCTANTERTLPETNLPLLFGDMGDPITVRGYVRRYLAEDKVFAVMKPYIYADPLNQDIPAPGNALAHKLARPYLPNIPDGAFNCYHDDEQRIKLNDGVDLTSGLIDKVVLGAPVFGRHSLIQHRMPAFVPWEKRKYDVGFMGQVVYTSRKRKDKGVWLPELHRQRCLDILNSLSDLSVLAVETDYRTESNNPKPKKYIRYVDYIAEMAQCRVVVAPFGWACWTYRDFEGLALGCAVVKPTHPDIIATPNIYRTDSGWFIPCNPGFRDLEAVIRRVLADPPQGLQEQADKIKYLNSFEQTIPPFIENIKRVMGI
jgi:hypothetical protein